MAVTVHDVLRAIVRGDRVLNDAGWQAEALDAIDADDPARRAAAAAQPAGTEAAPWVPEHVRPEEGSG